MAIQGALTNVAIYVHDTDISGDTSTLDFNISAKPLDTTTFGTGGWETMTTGLKHFTADFEGFVQLGATDASTEFLLGLPGRLGTSATPVTIAPTGGADGEPSYFFSGLETTFDQPMQVGDMAKYKTHFDNDSSPGGLARGKVMLPKASWVAANNGTQTVQTLGAVSATQKLYASLHVLSVSGTSPTLDVIVKSAVTNFATTSNRITFTQATAVGSQWATPVAGPITDTFWGVNITIGGSAAPTFVAVVSVAIL